VKNFRRIAFTVVVTSLAGALGFACSSDDGSEPIDHIGLGIKVADQSVRNGLFHCDADSDCSSAGQVCCAGYCALSSAAPGKLAQLVSGRLQYKCFSTVGNAARSILPDYSFAGYKGGGVALPSKGQGTLDYFVSPPSQNPPFQIPLMPLGGGQDDSARIQAQINAAGVAAASSSVPLAVRLGSGTFLIGQPLFIRNNKVVLAGMGNTNTIVRSTINAAHTLINVEPSAIDGAVVVGSPVRVSTNVRVGATRIPLVSVPSGWAVGDSIRVRRTPNQAWLDEIGTPSDWEPYVSQSNSGFPSHVHLRKITAIDTLTSTITLDIPMVDWIIENPGSGYFGGGHVEKIQPLTYVREAGVQDLSIDSVFSDVSTSDGSWNAIGLRRTRDSWVRNVTVTTYGNAAVTIADESMFNTVEEVAHLDPVSPLDPPRAPGLPPLPASGHRYSFNVSSNGTGNLFQRCFTRNSRHSFVSGIRTHGPNVWLDSMALNAHSDAGPHKEWNTGGLFDNIYADPSPELLANYPDASTLAVRYSSNHGWRGAQTMFWNADARVNSASANSSRNFVIGGVVENLEPGTDSIWQLENTVVKPRSLYLQQLQDRKGTAAMNAVTIPQQRAGRIFDALRAWAGVGLLKDAFADPTCATGDRASPPGPTCCDASCNAKCGAADCGSGGTASLCCAQSIRASGRSCAHYPPPCVIPDPDCNWGMENGQYCCSASCAACATTGCGAAPNNPPDVMCCSGSMQAAKRSCSEYPPPCIQDSDPTCAFGVPGPGNLCCDPACNQCDGAGCDDPSNPVGGCCAAAIIQANNSCSTHTAPCILP
jgi:hypothetical protein